MIRQALTPDALDLGYEKLLTLIASGEKITIAEAAERTGISAETITAILAIQYAFADELLKLLDPPGQSLH